MEVTETDISVLIEFLRRDCDIDFRNYAKSSFKRRIERILQLSNIDSCKMLIMKLKKDKAYLTQFIEEITVNTTELFRDFEFWVYLRDEVIPKIKDYHTIRIWHAGCSSGEEVFSMAILLKEAGLLDKTKLMATDLNESVIKRAKSGRYSAVNNLPTMLRNYNSFNPDGNFDDYHSVSGKYVYLDQQLIANVDFKKHNLAVDPAFAKVNLILCRNVLIYFDQDLQNKVVNLFHESMLLNSYLAIGSKETLMLSLEDKKMVVHNEKHRVYKKNQSHLA